MPRHIGIIIPFYYLSNDFKADIKTLQETVDASQPYAGKIVVVNDGTALSTIRNAEIISHDSNAGKGVSIRTGLAHLLSDKDIEFVIEIDADNDQDPRDVVRFLEAFKNKDPHQNYLVIGDRYAAPEMQNPGHYRVSINQLQMVLFSHFGFHLRDSVSGFRGYSRSFANEVLQKSKSNGFGIATEEIILAYVTNTTLKEIPLGYAKQRSNFTKAYKLGEVIDGITIHREELGKKDLQELIDAMVNLKGQIEKGCSSIKFEMSGRTFMFRYDRETYTID